VVVAGLASKVLVAAGVDELVAAVVVVGFGPNRPPVAGVDVAGAVVAGVAPPNKLGVAAAGDAAGAVVVAAVGNKDLAAAGVELAGAVVVGVFPNSPPAGAAAAGVLVPDAAALV
jgi:hypothetical protein